MRVSLRCLTALAVVPGLTGCMLDPLVEDGDLTSVNVLPPGSEVPRIDADAERVHQITVHDGLDDGPLAEAGGVVARRAGWAAGVEVKYWAFGPAPRTGAPVYVLVDRAGAPIDHPYLFDTMPGDPGYSPIRRVNEVTVTERYRGERVTTLTALADAIELGLVEEPRPAGTWFNMPVVPPGTTLEVGGERPPLVPVEVYAGGWRVDAFRFGGERGVQPLRNGAVPAGQATVMRESMAVAFLATPVFQWSVPAAPPAMAHNYTPLATRIEVQLAPGVVAADSVHGDADLFRRAGNGNITAVTALVASFEITERVENLQLQFTEGEP